MSLTPSHPHLVDQEQTQIPLSEPRKPHSNDDRLEEAIQSPLLSPKQFLIGLTCILPTLTITSILQIIFTEIANQANARDWPAWDVVNSDHYMIGSPTHLSIGPLRKGFQLASSYFCLSVCCIAVGLWWYSSKKGPMKTTYFRRFSIVATFGLNAVLALGSFIHVFTMNALSSRFDMDYALSRLNANDTYSFMYSKGTFDMESWACGTKNLPGFDENGVVHKTCTFEMGARFLTIFTFLFSTALFTIIWLDWRGAKTMMQTWKNRRASWRNDYV